MNENITEAEVLVMTSDIQRPQHVASFIQEIDTYLGKTFDAMTQIDESYGKFSTHRAEISNP